MIFATGATFISGGFASGAGATGAFATGGFTVTAGSDTFELVTFAASLTGAAFSAVFLEVLTRLPVGRFFRARG
jgi:hypothetical protein